MATLSEASKDIVWARYMEAVSKDEEPLSDLLKNEIRSAVDSADTQLDTGRSSLTNDLTDIQKSRLYRYVADQRFKEGV